MTTLETSALPTIAILGAGSMGSAILEGLLQSNSAPSAPVRITTNRKASGLKYLDHDGVIVHSLENDPHANLKAARGAKAIILGVKPHLITQLAAEIAPELAEDAVLISVAAGVTLESIKNVVPETVRVLRAMPNTPSLVGHGITGITAASDVEGDDLDLARRIFRTVGDVIMVTSENELDNLSAVSGSGPAYVFLFIEKMIQAATRLGFTEEQADVLVRETFLGASLLLDSTGQTPAELRRSVTSPNGTTEQAIKRFEAAGLDSIFDDALGAAINRAKELAAENG